MSAATKSTAKADVNLIAAMVRRADQGKATAARDAKKRKKTSRRDSTHNLDNEGVHDLNSPARQADERTLVSRDSDLPTTWVRPTSLDAPPPRPGFVNRWVRFRVGNEEDKDNLDKYMSQGWRPLPKSSIRKDHVLTANLEGKYGQFVVKRGLILMELPQNLWQQRQDFYDQKKIQMTESIDRNLFRENDRRTPFLKPERHTSVTRRARRGRAVDSIPGDE